MIWKNLGKESFAIHAPWPVDEKEDPILTRQAKFLRESLRSLRSQVGKAKKGWTKASILVTDSYPEWKVKLLLWMGQQHNAETGFSSSFMTDLKGWASLNIQDKKLSKVCMQFASFAKKETDEVGTVALDVQLPFDQRAIISECLKYIQVQLDLPEADIINLDVDKEAASVVPSTKVEATTPGKPQLFLQ
jgi:leucyl-tRNA synthetase